MTDHITPGSDWEHSHALNDGDEVVDTTSGETHTITVHDDGAVTLDGETFGEAEINAALRDGIVTRDGLGHELATY